MPLPYRPDRTRRTLALAVLIASVAMAAACAEAGVSGSQSGAGSNLDLTSAPWGDRSGPARIQDVEPLSSLTFASGVSYPEALTRLYIAARLGSAEVKGAVISAPLPSEVVYVTPADPGTGIRLSLTAPWGWVPGGAIRPPSIALPGSLAADEVSRRLKEAEQTRSALPEGATVDVPVLTDCQIAHGTPDARPPC